MSGDSYWEQFAWLLVGCGAGAAAVATANWEEPMRAVVGILFFGVFSWGFSLTSYYRLSQDKRSASVDYWLLNIIWVYARSINLADESAHCSLRRDVFDDSSYDGRHRVVVGVKNREYTVRCYYYRKNPRAPMEAMQLRDKLAAYHGIRCR